MAISVKKHVSISCMNHEDLLKQGDDDGSMETLASLARDHKVMAQFFHPRLGRMLKAPPIQGLATAEGKLSL